MKKGYTLIEMIIVLGIISILLAVIFPNFVPVKRYADLEQFTNQTAAMFRDAYETANKEVDYSGCKVVIDCTGSVLTIKFIKNGALINSVSTESIALYEQYPDSGNLSGITSEIQYDSTGWVVFKNGSEGSKALPELGLRLCDRDNPENSRTITIKSLPPGAVTVGEP